MSSNDSIEVTAPTIDQAINRALAELSADQDDVEIEVLSTPRAGVLGLGARQARVRVTRRPPQAASSGVTSPPPAPPVVRPSVPPTPPSRALAPAREAEAPALASQPAPGIPAQRERAERTVEPAEPPLATARPETPRATEETAALTDEASSLLGRILDLMGEKADIETVTESDVANPELNIKGDGSGLLIGRHGQTLDALEYVVNRILARKFKDAPPVSIDTESYRARRRHQLHRMALAKGEQAKREHLAVALDPMPPRDRRIIHLALKDDPLVTTRSSGEGFLRSIEIVPVDERRESSRGREKRKDRERENGRERDQSPLGQQGGFKHGQKKII